MAHLEQEKAFLKNRILILAPPPVSILECMGKFQPFQVFLL